MSDMERTPQGGDRKSKVHDGPLIPKSEFASAKENAGISDSQGKRWQKLAAVPEKDFEDAMQSLLR